MSKIAGVGYAPSEFLGCAQDEVVLVWFVFRMIVAGIRRRVCFEPVRAER